MCEYGFDFWSRGFFDQGIVENNLLGKTRETGEVCVRVGGTFRSVDNLELVEREVEFGCESFDA